ncbi:lysophospholipid acyltransferase family protein [Actibacterium sp. D379-3]
MAQARDKGRTIGNWLIDRILRGLIGLALALPYATRVRLMGWLTRAVIAPLAGYLGRAEANLALVWPDLPQAERSRIARAVADNAGRTLIENYSNKDMLARMAGVTPAGPGLAVLEQARRDKRPVLLITGHFGNYEAGRAALVARGFDIGGLYRPMQNPWFNEHYRRTMEDMGGPVFAQGRRGTAGFVRHLKQGGMMVLLIDQHNYRGAHLRFMGLPAQTATSAAEIALKYGALVIPFYGIRQPDGLRFAVEIEAPIPASDPETMTQALNDSLERQVHAHPEQWFWIHRRWKTVGTPGNP